MCLAPPIAVCFDLFYTSRSIPFAALARSFSPNSAHNEIIKKSIIKKDEILCLQATAHARKLCVEIGAAL